MNFNRSVDAQVNVKTGAAQKYSTDFDAILPSLLIHYAITPNWSAYAQAAEGFLAPNENFFTTNNPTTTKTQSPAKLELSGRHGLAEQKSDIVVRRLITSISRT